MGALVGFEAFRAIAKINFVTSITALPLLVGGASLGGIRGCVWAMLISNIINWVAGHLTLRNVASSHDVPFCFTGCVDEKAVLWKFSLPALMSGLMVSPFMWGASALLVNQPGGYAQMGLFEAANQWRLVVLFVPGIVGQVALPMLSSLIGTNNISKYNETLKYNLLINLVVGLIIASLISIFSPLIMSFYGVGFYRGVFVLIVLVFSAVLIALGQIVIQAIASLGKMWAGFYINLTWGLSLVFSSYFFLNNGYGALGLSISYLFACLIYVFVAGLYARKLLSARCLQG